VNRVDIILVCVGVFEPVVWGAILTIFSWYLRIYLLKTAILVDSISVPSSISSTTTPIKPEIVFETRLLARLWGLIYLS
jgi:hypothetical protein